MSPRDGGPHGSPALPTSQQPLPFRHLAMSDDSKHQEQPLAPKTPPRSAVDGRTADAAPNQTSGQVSGQTSASEPLTTTHHAEPRAFDATVISKRSASGRIAPPPADRLSNAAIGKQLEGTHLDDYLLEEFVGGGGMGAVFRAEDLVLRRTVAVKVLTTRHGDNDEEARRFEQEAQSAARLNHENIARVHGYGKSSGWQYIVLEFIEGQNLRDLVQQTGGLRIDDTISYAWQITEALEHASAQGIVHRDIKPSNVIVTPQGQAKLVDMGLAKVHQLDTGERDLTATGMTLGTFDYISPEQGEDPSKADVRSDLYSLGCTIYFMLVGQPPFPSGTPIQKILNHKNEPPPELRLLRQDIPRGLLAIVDCLLAKHPNDRFQTPRALSDALIRFADSEELPPRARAVARRAAQHQHGPLYNSVEWLVPCLLLAAAVFAVERLVPKDPIEQASLPEVILPITATSNPVAAPLKIPAASRRRRDTSWIPPEPTSIEVPPIKASSAATDLGDGVIRVIADSSRADGVQVFGSPQLALEAAQNNPAIKTIEFQLTGRFPVAPMRFSNRTLRLEAVGNAWPILEFRQVLGDDCAIQITGGRLDIQGVHFDLLAPTPANLFHLINVANVQMDGAWTTISGESDDSQTGAVFDISTAESPSERPVDVDELPDLERTNNLPTAIQLTDCVMRGDLNVLHVRADQPCRFQWDNGFLCTTGKLAELEATAMANADAGQHRIDVDHLTAVIDDGLLQANASETKARFITVDLNCTRSIFVARSTEPFVRMAGNEQQRTEFATSFFFGGQRNFYEQVTNFWQMTDEPAEDFSAWQERWSASESLAQTNKVAWLDPDCFAVRRTQATPAQFQLDASPNNPARAAGGGLQRSDAGFRLQELPFPRYGMIWPNGF